MIVIKRTGKFYVDKLRCDLRMIDELCVLFTEEDEDNGMASKVNVIPSSPDRTAVLESIIDAHDADAALAAWNEKEQKKADVPQMLKALTLLANATPAQIETWVDNNFLQATDNQRLFFRTLALAVKAYLNEKGV